jgi:hypothetical protein
LINVDELIRSYFANRCEEARSAKRGGETLPRRGSDLVDEPICQRTATGEPAIAMLERPRGDPRVEGQVARVLSRPALGSQRQALGNSFWRAHGASSWGEPQRGGLSGSLSGSADGSIVSRVGLSVSKDAALHVCSFFWPRTHVRGGVRCKQLHHLLIAHLVEVDVMDTNCKEWLGGVETHDLVNLGLKSVDRFKGVCVLEP